MRPIPGLVLASARSAALHPALAQDDAVRPRHPQRPDHRWHRLAVVCRRRRHSGRADRGDRAAGATPRPRQTVDAAGMVVAPGFIDMLGQSDLSILVNPSLPSKIFQGITTEITGEGSSRRRRSTTRSSRPIGRATSTTRSRPTGGRSASTSRGWRSRAWASTSPATSARRRCAAWCWATATGSRRRRARQHEGAGARRHARRRGGRLHRRCSIRPAPYAQDRGADRARRGGGEATAASTRPTCAPRATGSTPRSTRRSGSGARRSIPVEIWHLKVAGKRNWGRMPRVVAKIDSARAGRRGHRGRHLRLHRLVQLDVRLHPAVGARRRHRQADRAAQGPGDAPPDPARHARRPTARGTTSGRRSRVRRAVLIGVVQNPALQPYQGKTLAQVAADAAHRPDRRPVRPAGRGPGIHRPSRCSGCPKPDVALALSSRGCPSTTTRRARRRTGCWGRSILTRGRTAPFPGS